MASTNTEQQETLNQDLTNIKLELIFLNTLIFVFIIRRHHIITSDGCCKHVLKVYVHSMDKKKLE